MDRLRFPFGRAPLWLLVCALVSGLMVLASELRLNAERPDLVLATFVPAQHAAYERLLPQFEKTHGVSVKAELVTWQALRGRLQNALLAGAKVADLVELSEDSMGFYTRGPLSDIGFLDLTERIEREGLRKKIVDSRFSLWSTRGRVFALPHDVHPVMLTYRRDLVEELGIDVSKLETWDDFVTMGRRITRDLNGDGVPDRYALDLPMSGSWGLRTLLIQRGGSLIDARGHYDLTAPHIADTIEWYIEQTFGPERIAFEFGWGQPLAKALLDGLALFYITPDWRTQLFEMDVPKLRGKLGVMPLPAWTPGGRRTSVWGGSGLAITKQCRRPELAWELAKFLYLNEAELGRRFAETGVLPPFVDAWDQPELTAPDPFYSGQRVGQLFASLAPQTPPVYSSPYRSVVEVKLDEAFGRAVQHYKLHGKYGFRAQVATLLESAQRDAELITGRNRLAARDE
jgi:arabinosaccharide transport system substrate-binding protein